jgi:hypothetical protein
MLQFDPEKRLDIQQVINHPYFGEYHKPEYETKCLRTITADKTENSLKEYK